MDGLLHWLRVAANTANFLLKSFVHLSPRLPGTNSPVPDSALKP